MRLYLANTAAPIFLFAGPGQVVLVSAIPIILYGYADGSGQAAALNLYCYLRTGVTYIWAVLVSHLLSTYLMETVVLAKTGGGGAKYLLAVTT